MSVSLHWTDVALRLSLTVVVGILFGFNRSEYGKAAGMRTTLLVCLAASVAMLQVNALLPMAGRSSDSFVMNDLMRLPLGILTGVGFIGGGAILHRGNFVVGVTTAATLWLVTVIGLCLGGGQIGFALVASGLGLCALWALRWAEDALREETRGLLVIRTKANGPHEAELRLGLAGAGFTIIKIRTSVTRQDDLQTFAFTVQRQRLLTDTGTPPLVNELAAAEGVESLEWSEPI